MNIDKSKIAILPHREEKEGDVTDMVKKNYKRTFWIKSFNDWQKSQEEIRKPYKK